LSKILLIIAALAALLAALAWFMPAQRAALLRALAASQGKITQSPSVELEAKGKDDDAQAPSRIALFNGMPAVRLTAQERRRSGIRTAPLKQITFYAEHEAYGEVIDIQPLLQLRAKYDAARAKQRIAKARLQVSAQEYERLRELNEHGNIISAARMREAQSRWLVDQAQLTAAQTRVQNIRAQAVHVWGKELTAQAMADRSIQMRRLVDRDDVLLRITLAPGKSMTRATHIAFIDRNGDRHHARRAWLISAAPRTDPASQGETWFFRTRAYGLRTGMRVVAWLPKGVAPVTGVLLPTSAVVWYSGEPWVYVNASADLFARHAVPTGNEIPGGWLARDGFNPGEAVVVSGGQMLLSEEFREHIPEENED
jgi:hypothetical protein